MEAVVVVVVVFIGGVEVVGSVETAVVAVIGVVEHSSVLQCCPIAGPTVVAAVGAVEVVLVVVGSVEHSSGTGCTGSGTGSGSGGSRFSRT